MWQDVPCCEPLREPMRAFSGVRPVLPCSLLWEKTLLFTALSWEHSHLFAPHVRAARPQGPFVEYRNGKLVRWRREIGGPFAEGPFADIRFSGAGFLGELFLELIPTGEYNDSVTLLPTVK